jgi:hypothetical protein
MPTTVNDYPSPVNPTGGESAERTAAKKPPRRAGGRRARRRSIRIRCASFAVALFIGGWAVIGVQMASGHDPELAAANKRNTLAVDQTATTAAKSATAKRSSAAASTSATTTKSSSGATSVSTHQS